MSKALRDTVHASAVRVGGRAVLIRGASGSGKSRLAFDLIMAGRTGVIDAAVLVGDDRLSAECRDGDVVVKPAPGLAGLLEIRGLGLRRCACVAEAVVGLVVDLGAADAERLPPETAMRVQVAGVELPRIPVAAGQNALPLVVAALTTSKG